MSAHPAMKPARTPRRSAKGRNAVPGRRNASASASLATQPTGTSSTSASPRACSSARAESPRRRSQSAAAKLSASGFPVVGVPKTIDNDLAGTELTIGFLTAVEMCTHALDNLRATAESHNRVMVVEVMGRNVGWIAVEASIAGGADMALIPEFPFTLDDVCDKLKLRHEKLGRNYSMIVIAEGATDSEGVLQAASGVKDKLGREKLGGVGQLLARELESRTGYDARCTTLGYLQRCAAPTAVDRILATRVSDKAYDLLINGQSGMLAGLRGFEVQAVALKDVVGKEKRVTAEYYRLAQLFG